MNSHSSSENSIKEAVRLVAESIILPEPDFSISIGWAQSYDTLFQGMFEEVTPESNIVIKASPYGRILLTGRGGGGKSETLNRLIKNVVYPDSVFVLIRLKLWVQSDNEHWDALATNGERLSYLFRRFGEPHISPQQLDGLSPDLKRFVVIDGLNEVSSTTGQEIIFALEDFAQYAVNTIVIVSDRLVRRDFITPGRWELGMLLPLKPDEVQRILEAAPKPSTDFAMAGVSERTLLSTPYFLNTFIKGEGFDGEDNSSQFHSYFVHHALSENEIATVAKAAFLAYTSSSRTFNLDSFESVAGSEITQKLFAAGALRHVGDKGSFDHHLQHDYLASKYIVNHPDEWNPPTFSAATFNASSFEVVMMCMEQLSEKPKADLFLRRLYDWNLNAAGYSIAEGRHKHISKEMLYVILAVFAERSWDIFRSSADRARDTLGLIEAEEAGPFRNARGLAELATVVRGLPSEESWFDDWRKLFLLFPVDTPPTNIETVLKDEDSVIGWTSANVLKRLDVSEECQLTVRSLTTHNSATVQWRAAHVLGAFPSEQNIEALNMSLASEERVRFGATRSLIEIAAKGSEDLKIQAISKLVESIDLVTQTTWIVRELERALFIRKDLAPRTWTKDVRPILVALQRSTEQSTEDDRWTKVFGRLANEYGI